MLPNWLGILDSEVQPISMQSAFRLVPRSTNQHTVVRCDWPAVIRDSLARKIPSDLGSTNQRTVFRQAPRSTKQHAVLFYIFPSQFHNISQYSVIQKNSENHIAFYPHPNFDLFDSPQLLIKNFGPVWPGLFLVIS
jgi:hypothetical protein